jgi:predicted Zn-dependent protease
VSEIVRKRFYQLVFFAILFHNGFMKRLYAILAVLVAAVLIIIGCTTNPLTGKRTMAFVNNGQLFPSSFAQYDEFLKENTVITGTPDANMVSRIGTKLADAAEKWLAAEGNSHYLDDYQWEYKLVKDDAVNAWCMPGGKIVVYTGILPVTKTEAALAVVLGHEISHALLNHGQQRMSADLLTQLGAIGLAVGTAGLSQQTQSLAMAAYGIGSQLGGTIPFSRSHESEADHYGLILMAIAGYNPDEAVPFWERMAAAGGGAPPEFLSTHPSDATRIRQLQGWTPEAKKIAAEFGVNF